MDHPALRRLIGSTEVMNELRKQTYLAARTDLTVLIRGERGTGKELIAQALHQASRRAGNDFVAANSASLPETLVESELFGHTKGAFTGADRDKKGKFEQAHLGTLFLDEIAHLRKDGQAKLLRVLETGVIDKIGAEKPIRLDVRLVAATNRDLKPMAGEGSFLPDLYDRLNVYSITAPPLRDRLDDIPLLLEHFLDAYDLEKTLVRVFSSQIVEFFRTYSWPGNVRELQNILLRLFATCQKATADLDDLPPEFVEAAQACSAKPEPYSWKHRVSKQLCLDALAATGDNRPKAAQLLGISRAHFYRIIKMYGI